MIKILVVDDEASVRKMVTNTIASVGYEVIEASSGAEAYDACKETSIDLIITDVVMPDKNGIDLIMEVKKEYPDLPVIAISGGGGITGRFDYLEIAKLVGAKNILKKPFTTTELRSAVDNILNNEERA